MLKLRFAFLSILVFGVAHYLVSALASAVGVFLLNWWEPKWGSPLGSWLMDVTTFLPLATGASIIAAMLAVLVAWRHLRILSTRRLLAAGTMAGGATALVGYILIYLSQHVPRAAEEMVLAVAQVWLVLGAAVVWIIIAIGISRRSHAQQAA